MDMLDYRLHYALMATEDRVKDLTAPRGRSSGRGRPYVRLPRLRGRGRP